MKMINVLPSPKVYIFEYYFQMFPSFNETNIWGPTSLSNLCNVSDLITLPRSP